MKRGETVILTTLVLAGRHSKYMSAPDQPESETKKSQSLPGRAQQRINSRLPSGVRAGLGSLYIYTETIPRPLYQLASRDWIDTYHDTGVGAAFASMLGAVVLLAVLAVSVFQSSPEPTAANDPSNLVAVPGVNDFLPVTAVGYILAALVLSAAIHELAHGVAMVAEEVQIEEIGVGLLGGILPITAYVKPDDDKFEAVSSRSQLRVLAAGILSNILLGGLALVLLALPVTGSGVTAFAVYFQPVLESPVTTSVADLGIVTNFMFWTAFFNINFAFVNVLPVAILDGGRMIGVLSEVGARHQGMNKSLVRRVVVAVSSVLIVSIFSVVVVGPQII